MPVEDLKSKKVLRSYSLAIMEWKREYEHHETMWMIYGKAYRSLFYRRLLHIKDQEEALRRYHHHAKLMDMLQADIDNYERLIFLHYAAVEELEGSMDPFKGIDFRETPLLQQTLF